MLQKIPKKFTPCGSGQMIHFNVIAAVRENVRGKKCRNNFDGDQ